MEANFVCCICHKVPSNVVESACCNSLFCWDCVVGKPQHCPSCGELLDPTTCTENLAVKKIIDGIQVKCSNAGCNARFLVSERSSHDASCLKGSTLCPNSDLCGIIERGAIAQHVLECQFRRIECHMCERSLPLPGLQEHLDTECREVVAECQLCRTKLVRKNIPNHIEVACPNVETECPFASFGCHERPQRSQVDAHVNEHTSQHIRLMADAFHAQQVQISTLREQLAVTQEATGHQYVPRTGVLFQLDERLTAYAEQIQNSRLWNHPTTARLRTQATPRTVIAALFLFFVVLKLVFCALIVPRTFVGGCFHALKMIVKFVVILKVCSLIVRRVWRGAAWMRNNVRFAATVLAMSFFVQLIIFG